MMNNSLIALQKMAAVRPTRPGRCSTSCFYDHSGNTFLIF